MTSRSLAALALLLADGCGRLNYAPRDASDASLMDASIDAHVEDSRSDSPSADAPGLDAFALDSSLDALDSPDPDAFATDAFALDAVLDTNADAFTVPGAGYMGPLARCPDIVGSVPGSSSGIVPFLLVGASDSSFFLSIFPSGGPRTYAGLSIPGDGSTGLLEISTAGTGVRSITSDVGDIYSVVDVGGGVVAAGVFGFGAESGGNVPRQTAARADVSPIRFAARGEAGPRLFYGGVVSAALFGSTMLGDMGTNFDLALAVFSGAATEPSYVLRPAAPGIQTMGGAALLPDGRVAFVLASSESGPVTIGSHVADLGDLVVLSTAGAPMYVAPTMLGQHLVADRHFNTVYGNGPNVVESHAIGAAGSIPLGTSSWTSPSSFLVGLHALNRMPTEAVRLVAVLAFTDSLALDGFNLVVPAGTSAFAVVTLEASGTMLNVTAARAIPFAAGTTMTDLVRYGRSAVTEDTRHVAISFDVLRAGGVEVCGTVLDGGARTNAWLVVPTPR